MANPSTKANRMDLPTPAQWLVQFGGGIASEEFYSRSRIDVDEIAKHVSATKLMQAAISYCLFVLSRTALACKAPAGVYEVPSEETEGSGR
jgi:hypothetical protein